VLLLESAGFQVLVQSTQPDSSRPGVRWTTIVAEKNPLQVACGLDRIQSILAQGRKVATYKLALVPGLCAIGRTEPYVVRWLGGASPVAMRDQGGEEEVYVPLRSRAVRWLAYYWPLVNGRDFIAQSRGELPGSQKPIASRATLRSLADRNGRAGLYAALRDLEEHPERLRASLRKIAETIRAGPVAYAGTKDTPVFGYSPVARTLEPHVVGEQGIDGLQRPGAGMIGVALGERAQLLAVGAHHLSQALRSELCQAGRHQAFDGRPRQPTGLVRSQRAILRVVPRGGCRVCHLLLHLLRTYQVQGRQSCRQRGHRAAGLGIPCVRRQGAQVLGQAVDQDREQVNGLGRPGAPAPSRVRFALGRRHPLGSVREMS
jgi:hypothetical protein